MRFIEKDYEVKQEALKGLKVYFKDRYGFDDVTGFNLGLETLIMDTAEGKYRGFDIRAKVGKDRKYFVGKLREWFGLEYYSVITAKLDFGAECLKVKYLLEY